jgi:hypothetical protein
MTKTEKLKQNRFGHLDLKLGIYLEFVIWDLQFRLTGGLDA